MPAVPPFRVACHVMCRVAMCNPQNLSSQIILKFDRKSTIFLLNTHHDASESVTIAKIIYHGILNRGFIPETT